MTCLADTVKGGADVSAVKSTQPIHEADPLPFLFAATIALSASA